MSVRVTVDRELCIGSANCVHITDDAMQLDEEGVAGVVHAAAASPEQFHRAARSCPTGAITVDAAG
jgi:ferredoxin